MRPSLGSRAIETTCAPAMRMKFIATLEGAPAMRCACCLRPARLTVLIEKAGKRLEVACCKSHARMAAEEPRRFWAYRANRDRHFAPQLAKI